MALAGICLGFFLVLFDATAVNVAGGGIAGSLGASVIEVQWVLNAYTVAFAALMLTAGSLGDRWGHRRIYLGGSALFAVASAACAVAPSAHLLIGARAVQGAGAAAVVPCSLALIAHRFPEGRARARALGVWGGVSGVGLAAGPVVGGGLVAAWGWRAVFLVVVPVAAVSMAIVAAWVEKTPRRQVGRPDLVGQVLAVITLVSLTAALTQTSTLGWSHPCTLGLLGVGALAGSGFVLLEHRVHEPMLPPVLFTTDGFGGVTGIGLLFNFGLYGGLFCLTLVLERALHQSAAVTGLVLLPLTAVVAICALVSGRLTSKFGPKTPMLLGLTGGVVGAGLLAGLGDRLGVAGLAGLGAVLGLVGLAMPAMTDVALTAAAPQRAGLGAAVLNAARQAGGALGVALLGSAAVQHVVPRGPSGTPRLLFPMALTAVGYLIALMVTVVTIRRSGDGSHGPGACSAEPMKPSSAANPLHVGTRSSRSWSRKAPCMALLVRLLHNAEARAAYWSDWASGVDAGANGDGPISTSESRHRKQLHRIARLIETGHYDAAWKEAGSPARFHDRGCTAPPIAVRPTMGRREHGKPCRDASHVLHVLCQ
ncbi:MAG TPA: MFS transporter [Nocardioidaceae bacterium]|nr:MFS transporter [Nocardioidaceae bacterium]